MTPKDRHRAFFMNSAEGFWGLSFREPLPLTLDEETLIEEMYQQGTLIDCNPSQARFAGTGNPEALLGGSLSLILPRLPRNENSLRIFSRGKFRAIDVESERHDSYGQVRSFLNNISGEIEGQRLVRLWGTQREVTSLRRIEDRVLELQKLEAVGRLAGGVAHDFNNLLSVIAAYTSTLYEQAPPNSTARDDLEQIQIAAERGTQVTRQLLAFSRRDQWQPHSVDLNRLIRGSKKILAHIIGARIVLSTNLGATLYPIFADPSAIEQVILNLVLNAHDAMLDGGTIWIETSNAYLGTGDANHIAGPHVMLSVRDNGSGMSPDTLARIYEPFFTTKPIGKGTGLGLALVRSVVQKSGGQITVDSALGRGTTFTLRFPRDLSNTAAATKKALPPPKPGTGEVVLVVDDDLSVLRAASDVLARFGYRVLSAASAEQAEQLAHNHKGPIHLLLTDVVMPKENGPDLARSLRAHVPGLRVVYMSSYGPNTSLHYGVSPFGPDYLSKPFNAESLARIVRHSLDQPPPSAPTLAAVEAEP